MLLRRDMYRSFSDGTTSNWTDALSVPELTTFIMITGGIYVPPIDQSPVHYRNRTPPFRTQPSRKPKTPPANRTGAAIPNPAAEVLVSTGSGIQQPRLAIQQRFDDGHGRIWIFSRTDVHLLAVGAAGNCPILRF